MGFFSRKRSPDVVDLTDMRIRGMLPDKLEVIETDKEGMIDFSSQVSSKRGDSSTGSAGDFLSSLAGVGASAAASSSSGGVTESLRTARRRNIGNAEINELRIRLEDSEYKINKLSQRIMELESKIRNMVR